MNLTPTTGTTLAIVSPYLPYGIEVKDNCGDNFRLHGLKPPFGLLDAHSYLGKDLKVLKPILRPFSQLDQPLWNKAVPAIEVTKLLVNDWAGDYRYVVRPTPNGLNVDVFGLAGYMEDDEVQEFTVLLYSDWDWEIKRVGEDVEYSPTHNPAQAIDYLRSQHFAVGLEPHQYIVKEVDK